MFFEVPQYIDIEDKIAFQLTTKQLGWFALGGVLVFLSWSIFEKGAFILASILIAMASSAMAFIRPYGLSMAALFSYGVVYFLKPRMYIWQKAPFQVLEKENEKKTLKREELKQKKAQTALDRSNLKVDEMADFLDNVQRF